MRAIVSVDYYWGIGFDGQLLEQLPAHSRNIRERVYGKVVVLGRKTFETLYRSKPLENCTTIVLSKNTLYDVPGVIVVHNEHELLKTVEDYGTNDVFILGGESVYGKFLKYCDSVFVTHINRVHKADKYFIDLNEHSSWKCTSLSSLKQCRDFTYNFTEYIRC